MADYKELKRLSEEPGFGPEGAEEYQPNKQLNFTDEQGLTLPNSKPFNGLLAPEKEAKQNALMGILSSLGNRFSNNLTNSDQMSKDASTIMMDRAIMQNPNKQGPRLPDVNWSGQGMLPQEKAYMDSMANGMMGSVGAVGDKAAQFAMPEAKAVIAKSTPWMQGITKEAIEAAISKGEGIAKTGTPIMREYLEKLRALTKRY